jgi:hypothetical protein
MNPKPIWLCLLMLMIGVNVAGQQTPPAKNRYEDLLERVKQGDQSIDFKELRLAYTETSTYSPYGRSDDRGLMFQALKAKKFDKVLESAEKILASNYLDMNGHFGCFVAHRELGHADKAAYHRYLFEGLLNSIRKSGDGKTPETAFVVISTDEEYVLFNYLGLRPTGQALINEKGHSYDKMTAVDPKTNETVVYYFNIDTPFNWLGNSLKH